MWRWMLLWDRVSYLSAGGHLDEEEHHVVNLQYVEKLRLNYDRCHPEISVCLHLYFVMAHSHRFIFRIFE